jgi:large subunit ribosomal protein L19
LAKYVERVDTPQMKDDLIPFRVGMTAKVGVTVVEGGKSRVQPYEGIVIAIHRAGVATTITVRKTFQGYGVERIFPIHSPLCAFEEVRGAGKPVVRRAKLYYLRDLVGKKAKLKTRFVAKKVGATRHEIKMEALAATKAAAAAEVEMAAAAAVKAEEDAAAAAEAEAAAPVEAAAPEAPAGEEA